MPPVNLSKIRSIRPKIQQRFSQILPDVVTLATSAFALNTEQLKKKHFKNIHFGSIKTAGIINGGGWRGSMSTETVDGCETDHFL